MRRRVQFIDSLCVQFFSSCVMWLKQTKKSQSEIAVKKNLVVSFVILAFTQQNGASRCNTSMMP